MLSLHEVDFTKERNTMKGMLFITQNRIRPKAVNKAVRSLSLVFVLSIGSLLLSCNMGTGLSREKAAKIIASHFKYPNIISEQVSFQQNSGEMLKYMIKEGYIASVPAQACCGAFYATTEKGKPFFGDMVKYFSNGDLYVTCGYARRTILSIKEMSIDTRSGSATVEYVEGVEPNEPIYSAMYVKSNEAVRKADFSERHTKRVKLTFDNRNWSVERQSNFVATN